MKPNAIKCSLSLWLALGGASYTVTGQDPSFLPAYGSWVSRPMEGDFPSAAWADINGDGWVDLFVVGSRNSVIESRWSARFINQRNGTFAVWNWFPDEIAGWHGCSWGDYDNDGDLDLFLARRSGFSRLFQNLGGGNFRLVTTTIYWESGPGEGWFEERPWGIEGDTAGVAWGDFDGDGYLDLFLTNLSGPSQLWRNSKDGLLVPVNSAVSQIVGSDGCAWGDYDNDGDQDLFVAVNFNRNNALFRNDQGTLVQITTGDVVNNGGYSVGCAWGDYDNDGHLDLYVANRLGPNFLYRNNGDGSFTRVLNGPQVEDVADSNGCTWADFDNDGDLDLFVANFSSSFEDPMLHVYRNQGNGTFERFTQNSGFTYGGMGSAVVLDDYDNDGFLDLFVSQERNFDGDSILCRNSGNANHWLRIRLQPTSGRTHLGARVRVLTTVQGVSRWQMREVVAYDGWGGTSDVAHFGLGPTEEVEELEVRWPSGVVSTLRRVAADQLLTVRESSLPFQISPDGGFFTDTLQVTITNLHPDGEVRYTLDGTEPQATSPLYSAPITLTSSTLVRALLFKNGQAISDELTALFLENRWNDSIPVAWREVHFGPSWFNREDAAALADADDDGANTLQEWLAETDPLDPNSLPAVPAPLLVLDPPGGEFELAVTVRAESPVAGAALRYTLDGTEPGATAPILSEGHITLTDSANLQVRAFFEGNPVSPVVAGAYTIRPVPPRIVRQPAGQAVLAGATVELVVEAVGTSPLAFQWWFNDAELPGATEPVLRLVEVQPSQGGTYRVQVSNALESVTSDPAVLVVNLPPQILSHPQPVSVPVGAPATFTVEVAGNPPLTFEWYHNNARLLEAPNAPEFTLAAVRPEHAGYYHVRVLNPFGEASSAPAQLTVLDPPALPEILAHPSGVEQLEGEAAALTVTAIGAGPLNFQWFHNGQPLPEATAARLEWTALRLDDAGTYWVEVRNATGRVTSRPAVVRVVPLEPGGTVHFNNRVHVAGVDAPVFEADGTTPLAGPAYLAQLHAGPTPDALEPVGAAVPFRTGAGAGYITGGVVVIPGVAPGAQAYVQMRVWESARGPDYYSALRAGSKTGVSNVLPLVTGGAGSPPSFPADLVGLESFQIGLETEPPVLVLSSPAAGLTDDDRFILAGTATDNVAVATVTWEWNGRDMGELALAEGRFELAGLRWARGENRLRLRARDTAGNTAVVEVLVTYQPARLLTLSLPASVQEGSRLAGELALRSPGGVGGLTLVVQYDPERFRDPVWTWSDTLPLNAALTEVNLQEPGLVRATLSSAGGELPVGAVTLATLSLRTRSVPQALTSALVPLLVDVADRTGAVLDYGNGADSGEVEIRRRRLPGDNNGNDALDVGDAVLIQRLIALLDPVRTWDVTGNDLNGNETLDSGDVIKVLRVAVGLDPAPAPLEPGWARLTARGLPALAAPRPAGAPATGLILEADRLALWPGERVTVRVRLTEPPEGLIGLSFQLQYPAHALQLVSPDPPPPGPAVPAGVTTLITADDTTGQVHFAAAGTTAWTALDTPVLELTFQALPALGATGLELALAAGQVAWDQGYEVASLPPTGLTLLPHLPRLEAVTLTADDGVVLELATVPGLTYRLEVSEDLRTWEPLATRVSTSQTLRWSDPATDRPARFYRLVVLP